MNSSNVYRRIAPKMALFYQHLSSSSWLLFYFFRKNPYPKTGYLPPSLRVYNNRFVVE